MTTLAFYGLRRSGNHAIINWVAKKYSKKVIFYNNMRDKRPAQIFTYNDGEDLECEIYSYEDYPLDQIGYSAGNCTKFLIMRDPINLYLSRTKGRYNHGFDKQKYLDWFWLAQQPHMNTICFNFWYKSLTYRKNLAQKINVEFSDDGKEDIMNTGGGSSFVGTSLDKSASKLKVLSRFDSYVSDIGFQKFMENNSDLVDLARIYFRVNI